MSTLPPLIAIHGVKGAGKDTVATMLHHFRPSMTKWAFGDRLKQICALTFGVDLKLFYDEATKEEPVPRSVVGNWQRVEGPSPRQLCTSMADTLKARYGGFVFALHLSDAMYVKKHEGGLIVTDLRAYDNEERVMVDGLGGRVIHVLRDPAKRPYTDYSHNSEQMLEVKDGDIVIENNGTRHDLLMEVRKAVITLYGPHALDSYPYVPPDGIVHT